MISFNITDSGVIILCVNNKPFPPIPKDHQNYEKIKEAIRAGDEEAFEPLINVAKKVEDFVNVEGSKATVKDGIVFYDNKPLDNTLANKIIGFITQNLPVNPMLRFLENVMMNESYRAIKELYTFLQHQKLPITEDGHFLAYKRVSDTWMDLHTGTIDNRIGQEPFMSRRLVDDDFEVGCSNGLHVGAISYVRGFGQGGHVIICKVHPKDVISVPKDANCTKLRCCRYLVVDEYKGDLDELLYDPQGQPFVSTPDDEEIDDDEEDEEDEEFDDEEFDDDEEEEEDDPFAEDGPGNPPPMPPANEPPGPFTPWNFGM